MIDSKRKTKNVKINQVDASSSKSKSIKEPTSTQSSRTTSTFTGSQTTNSDSTSSSSSKTPEFPYTSNTVLDSFVQGFNASKNSKLVFTVSSLYFSLFALFGVISGILILLFINNIRNLIHSPINTLIGSSLLLILFEFVAFSILVIAFLIALVWVLSFFISLVNLTLTNGDMNYSIIQSKKVADRKYLSLFAIGFTITMVLLIAEIFSFGFQIVFPIPILSGLIGYVIVLCATSSVMYSQILLICDDLSVGNSLSTSIQIFKKRILDSILFQVIYSVINLISIIIAVIPSIVVVALLLSNFFIFHGSIVVVGILSLLLVLSIFWAILVIIWQMSFQFASLITLKNKLSKLENNV